MVLEIWESEKGKGGMSLAGLGIMEKRQVFGYHLKKTINAVFAMLVSFFWCMQKEKRHVAMLEKKMETPKDRRCKTNVGKRNLADFAKNTSQDQLKKDVCCEKALFFCGSGAGRVLLFWWSFGYLWKSVVKSLLSSSKKKVL